MSEAKSTRTKDGLILSGHLPQEFLAAPSFDIVQLRDGSFLLTPKKEARKAGGKKNWELTEPEKELLRKLLAIKFENRMPAEVNRTLSKDEMQVLDSLMEKNAVQILRGGKYAKEGVYNLSEFAFHLVRDGKEAGKCLPQATPLQIKPSAPPANLTISSPAHLDKFGWMVLENESDARGFSNSFPDRVRSGAVKGIRAFDRKYYFVTPAFVQAWEKKVYAALAKGEKTAEELADEIGLTAEGCRCLMFHLCEGGEVLEKRRGKFARA